MSINISGMMKSIRNIMREDTGLNGDAQRIEQLGWMIFIKVFSDKEKELELMEDGFKRFENREVVVQHVRSTDRLWTVTNDGMMNHSFLTE